MNLMLQWAYSLQQKVGKKNRQRFFYFFIFLIGKVHDLNSSYLEMLHERSSSCEKMHVNQASLEVQLEVSVVR